MKVEEEKKKSLACPKSQVTWKNLSKEVKFLGRLEKIIYSSCPKKSSMSPPIPGALSSQESAMQH